MKKPKFNFMNESEPSQSEDTKEVGVKFKKEVTKNKTYYVTPENQKKFIGFLFACAGLVGLYFNIEYSGWLIFFAFCML